MQYISFSDLVEVGHSSKDSGRQLFAGTDAKPAILFPPVVTAQWEEQVCYLKLLIVTEPLIIFKEFILYFHKFFNEMTQFYFLLCFFR